MGFPLYKHRLLLNIWALIRNLDRLVPLSFQPRLASQVYPFSCQPQANFQQFGVQQNVGPEEWQKNAEGTLLGMELHGN
jgi:hypothetical protein